MDEQKPQEVIAKWIKANTEHRQWYICPKCSYQAPRFKDEWVELTEEEIEGAIDEDFAYGLGNGNLSNEYVIRYARVIESMLKEKNSEK